MKLTGKWKYRENYGYGVAEGEVVLQQEKNKLSGRIIFTDKTEGDGTSMIQEFLSGEIEGLKVRIQAREFDVIYSEHKIEYKLDNWFGILVEMCIRDRIKIVIQYRITFHLVNSRKGNDFKNLFLFFFVEKNKWNLKTFPEKKIYFRRQGIYRDEFFNFAGLKIGAWRK